MSRRSLSQRTPEQLQELGASMHEITASLKDLGPGKKRRWFQGPMYCDLIVDLEEGEIIRFELTFEGQWLAVERTRAATGSTDELTLGGATPSSRVVTRDAALAPDVMNAAYEVLAGITDMALATELMRLLKLAAPA
ncbi:MAG: hypothetical protein JST54_26685 [Deltaproteobacteria bacterium]|nr:hypothetical protein [Deltaproteobacteria bacterium]